MVTETRPSEFPYASASLPILGVCLVLSLVVHIFTAGGISSYASSSVGMDPASVREIKIPDMPVPPQPEEPEWRLGRQDANTASITWLGVLENPIEGEAPESEVEQAELAINTGVQEISQPTPSQPALPAEPVTDSVSEPDQNENEAVTQELPEQAEQTEPEPVEQPEQVTPLDPVESGNDPVIETNPSEQIDPEQQPERVEDPNAIEPTPERPAVQTESQVIERPESVQSEPARPEEARPPSEQPTQATTSAETAAGKPGEEDDRESVASMIKRAKTHKVSDLNRPLSSDGLEIKPVEPRYPATVRFTQLPRNPIVIIRFNAAGKVIFTDFIRDVEKKRVYDTGSRAVDEPLLSAIYKWRATGKQLQQLDPEDPGSYLEITMKIIFRDETD